MSWTAQGRASITATSDERAFQASSLLANAMMTPRLRSLTEAELPAAGCSESLDFSPAQPRRAETRRSAGKTAASEEARRTLRYVEPLNDARTPLAGFFSILLEFVDGDGTEQIAN